MVYLVPAQLYRFPAFELDGIVILATQSSQANKGTIMQR